MYVLYVSYVLSIVLCGAHSEGRKKYPCSLRWHRRFFIGVVRRNPSNDFLLFICIIDEPRYYTYVLWLFSCVFMSANFRLLVAFNFFHFGLDFIFRLSM